MYYYVLHYLKFNKKKTKLNFIMFSIELTHLLRSMLRLKISYFITHPIHENCIFQTSKACLIIHFTSVEHHFVRLHHAIRSRRVFFYPLLTFHSLFTVLYDYMSSSQEWKRGIPTGNSIFIVLFFRSSTVLTWMKQSVTLVLNRIE